MRFHVANLPHTNTTSDFVVCAYTEKTRKFCNMMFDLGHTVYLYGGEFNEARCTEHIPCISEEERLTFLNGAHYVNASFDYNSPTWVNFNGRVISAIEKRAEPKDFICLIGGVAQQQIADFFPAMMSVEFGIGYGGTFAKYKVFESYAWMHTVYGAQSGGNAHDIDGNWYDAVIPNYFEVDKFPLREEKDDYFLYVGRLIDRKGFQIAADVCEKLGERLIIAGGGNPPEYGEYVGLVNEEERGRLMSGAKAVFVPTQYVEPFGGVAIEAMLCGTPVITTDFGAFTETVLHGLTGYRCRSFGEFCKAAQSLDDLLPPASIHRNATAHWGTDVVALQYQAYFERLETLWNEGFYSELSWLSAR